MLDGGSVTVRRMRAFAVANEMGLGGVSVAVFSCFRQFVCGFVAWYALMTWDPDEGGGAFLVGYYGSAPCSGSACCRSVGVYCDVGLRFPN